MCPNEAHDTTVPAALTEEMRAALERKFIAEYLRQRGYPLEDLHRLTMEQVQSLLREASSYASGKLAELEARASVVEDLHEAASTVK